MLTHNLVVVHLGDMLVGTLVTIGTGVEWFLWIEELTYRPVRIKAKVVFLTKKRLKLEPFVLCFGMYHWVEMKHRWL